jgi:hypothetical protein
VATKKNDPLGKLYGILRKMECELQMLGVRSDFGSPTEPGFAAETLTSCIQIITQQPNTPEGTLMLTVKDLLDTEMRRSIPHADTHTLAQWSAADEFNKASFQKLVEAYRAEFTMPEEFKS